jgi:hypothetical protein
VTTSYFYFILFYYKIETHIIIYINHNLIHLLWMLPLYLSEDDEYPDSRSLSCKSSSSTKSPLVCDDPGDSIYNVYDNIREFYGKYEKRRQEKQAKFAFKVHRNVYYKPEWVCAPGYDYPGPQHIPHKLVTAVRADKIITKPRNEAKRIALSKKKSRRPSKYIFESEIEFKPLGYTHRSHKLWGFNSRINGK